MVIHKGFACKKTNYCSYVYNTLNLYRNQYHILKIISDYTISPLKRVQFKILTTSRHASG
jgi:hypothetical protein